MGGMLLYAYDLKFGGEGLASAATLGSPPGFKGVRFLDHRLLVAVDRIAHTPLAMIFRGAAPLYNYWWRPRTQLIPVNWDNLHPALRPRDLFHGLELPKPMIGKQINEWASRGEWIMFDGKLDVERNLGKLRTPLLAVFGGIDPFTPEHKIKTFFNSIENPDKRLVVLSRHNGHSANYSHIEIPIAPETDAEVAEPIIEWFREHAMSEAPARAMTPSPRKHPPAGPRSRRRSKSVSAREAAALNKLPNVRLSAVSKDTSSPQTRVDDGKPAAEPKAPARSKRVGSSRRHRRR
jgi:pimeloyl-ACP methyl ester carboxylesterase